MQPRGEVAFAAGATHGYVAANANVVRAVRADANDVLARATGVPAVGDHVLVARLDGAVVLAAPGLARVPSLVLKDPTGELQRQRPPADHVTIAHAALVAVALVAAVADVEHVGAQLVGPPFREPAVCMCSSAPSPNSPVCCSCRRRSLRSFATKCFPLSVESWRTTE